MGAPHVEVPEPSGVPQLHRWSDRPIVGAAVASFASGFAQFGVVAALASVAHHFGHLTHGGTLADQVGLSGTTLGAGLAIIRLASLGGLVFSSMADRHGRRRMLLVTLTIGLVVTVVSSFSPNYWWFVVVFACGRPLLSATSAISEVIAAEHTDAAGRASAMALVAATYGIGAGLIAVLHSLLSKVIGFRGVFLLAIIPLLLVPLVRRWVTEPDRYTIVRGSDHHSAPVLEVVEGPYRFNLVIIALVAFALSFITGPANSFVFLYAQDVAHLGGVTTALMVVGAGAPGLVGLLAGRWMCDHVGRRITGAIGMVGLGVCGLLTYTGPRAALVVGYLVSIMFGSVLAPALGALVNELFATSVRASASGWFLAAGVVGAVCGLVAFGAVATTGDRFALAAAVTFIPASLVAGLFWTLPETMGRELEDIGLE